MANKKKPATKKQPAPVDPVKEERAAHVARLTGDIAAIEHTIATVLPQKRIELALAIAVRSTLLSGLAAIVTARRPALRL